MQKRLLFALCLALCLAAAIPGGRAAQERQEQVAQVLVIKSDRRMYLFDRKGNALRRYKVSLGKNPVGHKQQEGDGRTPEGRYLIHTRNPNSRFHLSLRISYPAPADRQRAKKMGVSPGGDIFIHGKPNGKAWMSWKYNDRTDWTDGCIAVADRDIREIWDLVPDGTPILILP